LLYAAYHFQGQLGRKQNENEFEGIQSQQPHKTGHISTFDIDEKKDQVENSPGGYGVANIG
jgi:hypothetical protein